MCNQLFNQIYSYLFVLGYKSRKPESLWLSIASTKSTTVANASRGTKVTSTIFTGQFTIYLSSELPWLFSTTLHLLWIVFVMAHALF